MHCSGRLMTASGAEKFEECHKYFLQYSAFAFEGTKVRAWGRQTFLSSRAPSNFVMPLNTVHLLPEDLRFEHGDAKLAYCPRRHLPSLRRTCALHLLFSNFLAILHICVTFEGYCC